MRSLCREATRHNDNSGPASASCDAPTPFCTARLWFIALLTQSRKDAKGANDYRDWQSQLFALSESDAWPSDQRETAVKRNLLCVLNFPLCPRWQKMSKYARKSAARGNRSEDAVLHPGSAVEEAGDGAARRHEFIASRRQFVAEPHLQHGQGMLKLLQRARTHQRRGDARLVFHPKRGQLRCGQGRVGPPARRLCCRLRCPSV